MYFVVKPLKKKPKRYLGTSTFQNSKKFKISIPPGFHHAFRSQTHAINHNFAIEKEIGRRN